jgi:branched-chain amino acid aminotransferase
MKVANRGGAAYGNGEITAGDAANISIFDHGPLYGDGVYNTAFAQYGYVFKLRDHVDRLMRSARAIHLELREPCASSTP